MKAIPNGYKSNKRASPKVRKEAQEVVGKALTHLACEYPALGTVMALCADSPYGQPTRKQPYADSSVDMNRRDVE